MKNFILFIIVILILLTGCEEKTTETTSPDENEAHFSYPTQGINVSGRINITVEGTNIDYVVFRCSGNIITDENSPYQISFNSTNYPNGEYTVRAIPVFDDGSSTNFTVDFWIYN